MKKTKNLPLLCLFGMIGIGASAYDFEVGGIYYQITSSTDLTCSVTYETDSYNSYSGTINIPSTVMFSGKTFSVNSIGEDAFHGCNGLTSVNLPNSVTSIDLGAFFRCSSLTSVTIPKSVTNIGASAFEECSGLTSITISESVTSIGHFAFYGCNLTSIVVNEDNPVYDSRNSCNAIIETATGSLIVGCQKTIIPESVTKIDHSAFSGCRSMTAVIIPNTVTDIGDYAFSGCSSLTSITIPESVTSIGKSAFDGCSSLPVFENIRYADNYAVEAVDKKQYSYSIKEGTKWIGSNAFSYCINMTSVAIPNSVTSIGFSAFYNCHSLANITLPDGVTSIEDYAFYQCSSLASITLPDGVTSIGGYAFSRCSSLTSVISFIQEPFPFWDSVLYQSDNCVLKVPAGTKEAYIAQGWSEDIFRRGILEMTLEVIALSDGTTFTNAVKTFYNEINYTRTFSNTEWQSLYVLFEIPLTVELLEEFEFAYINGAKLYDWDDDGTAEDMRIEVFKTQSGTLRANHPYLIRAKATGTKTITVNNATLYATEENSIDCSTTELLFTFTGSYQTLGYNDIGGCYLLGGGTWNPVTEGGTMRPMRFYLKIESRGNGQVIPASALSNPIRMTVYGEDGEVTEVDSPFVIDNEQLGSEYFDLQGRPVENPERGIYIINGKKVFVQ